MKDRIEVEKAENGYTITVWKNNEDEEYGYVEPTKYVATDEDDVLKIVKEHLK
jgi:hypothetical protein